MARRARHRGFYLAIGSEKLALEIREQGLEIREQRLGGFRSPSGLFVYYNGINSCEFVLIRENSCLQLLRGNSHELTLIKQPN